MNRHAVRAALIDKLRAADPLTGIQIELVWPGEQTADEAIYLLPSQGTITVPVFHGTPSPDNPLTLQDDFTIRVEIKACAPGQDDVTADERVDTLIGHIETVLKADPTLGGVDGLFWAIPSEIDGPGPGRSTSGTQAFGQMLIECMSR